MRQKSAKKIIKHSSSIEGKEISKKDSLYSPLPEPMKYKLYSDAVQSPVESVDVFNYLYNCNFNKKAVSLREDFCGTFLVGCEWVKSDPQRTALGIDLGQEPLRIAKRDIASRLKNNQRKRAAIYRQDVRVPTIPRVDIVAAENFSFYIFKSRADLVSYFRSAYSSLNKNGILILDMVGGAKFIETPNQSLRKLNVEDTGLPAPVVYRWRQRQFNAVSNEAIYHIDFKIKDQWYKDVFTYDWRVWTIPEVTEAIKEAGFDEAKIYWKDDQSETLSLKPVTKISSHWQTWMCIVTGIKR